NWDSQSPHDDKVFSSPLESTPSLSSGCDVIDRFLGSSHGLVAGQTTEIYGESRSGKTSFAIQLLLQVQLPYDAGGLEGGAIYISTSSRFSISRLDQVFQSFRHPDWTASEVAAARQRFFSRIHIVHIRDLDTQTHILKYQIPQFMHEHNVRLVVIDSIAANFRANDDGSLNPMDPGRAKQIFETGEILRQLAVTYSAVILLVNEVSARFDRDVRIAHDTHGTSFPLVEPSDGCSYVPALGVALSVIVNTRIRFHRSAAGDRSMHIVYSPQAPSPSSCSFVLGERGIRGIEAPAE
ncbi:DNA repair protein xrcc3, partial [Kappamyces sp. JEL0680]